ncbi:peptide/nickel transport system ATP-binding protein [Rhodococcus rhodochrous J3]|uniref:ABC transporter ATP-binding protein n=2 Tax=Rhodococcus rhodochrous TaxID=1829 RepID=A0AA47AFE9_RHORH|nr:ABC transporter ATP-binding protein [Rhodococcus rhodochrous]MCD2099281.1 ABC transporter ATP-binding protein [Rhodococcus rhodochrous]MCD2123714.1 ABC transporter ATP-binding protein [Rhodococcus rhodochrous]MCQ4136257.1 ABC transporter ATP-binding protein [Rhodococcus rhodochrous]MDJ0020510.1 ABC transporter ATP-binding protein [Rhodococcus rhodochrous]UZF47812.1 ABC transporter ATP-binding protein [Rhodococcus rhodochrous]
MVTDLSLSPPPPKVQDDVLQIDRLSVEFSTDHGWTKVVDDVSFNVPLGTTVGLVGESGSGKTVTSLAVMGLLPSRGVRVTGSVQVAGREMVGLTDRQLSDIRGADVSMVFQEPRRSLSPAFTVGDQIAEVVRRHEGLSKKASFTRAVEMLDIVGIDHAARRARAYPHEFSGGMCQRVMLAIAMVCKPKLLIADEPTTALDVTVQKEMLRLMKELQHEFDVSILFITHDLGVVAEMCDRVNVMYAGQVVESTTIDDLFDDPRHPYTEGLLAAIPDPRAKGARLSAIPGAVPAPWDWPNTCRFQARCTHAEPGRCDAAPIALHDLTEGRGVRCVRESELTLKGLDG